MNIDTCEHGNPRGRCDVTPHRCAIERISLRDEIAMRAMVSIIDNLNEFFPKKFTTAGLATTAYILADAMLKSRSNTPQPSPLVAEPKPQDVVAE